MLKSLREKREGLIIMLVNIIFLIGAIALSGIVLYRASIHDLKTREIPDSLTVPAMQAGFILAIAYALFSWNGMLAVFSCAGFIFSALIAHALFNLKYWGGGDAKLYMALSVINAPHFIVKEWPVFFFVYIIFIFAVGFGFGVHALITKKKTLAFAPAMFLAYITLLVASLLLGGIV